MTYAQILKHFGTATAAAEFLGISTAAVAHWKRRGFIPVRTQALLQVRTAGKLQAEVAHQKTQRRRVKK